MDKRINIFGTIDPHYGMSLSQLPVEELEALTKDDKVIVNINSEGGSVYEGFAIYDFLKGLDATVETRVVGAAMSIASIVFLAGAERILTPNSELMIHMPWSAMQGDSEDFKKNATRLEEIETKLVNIYSQYMDKDKDVCIYYILLRVLY